MMKADEYIDELVAIFSVKPMSLETRLSMASFIGALLGNWAYNNNLHKIEAVGIIEMAREVINTWNEKKGNKE
jgi:hypothetical protein